MVKEQQLPLAQSDRLHTPVLQRRSQHGWIVPSVSSHAHEHCINMAAQQVLGPLASRAEGQLEPQQWHGRRRLGREQQRQVQRVTTNPQGIGEGRNERSDGNSSPKGWISCRSVCEQPLAGRNNKHPVTG